MIVLLGNGDGSFQAAVSFRLGNGPASLLVADLNGDKNPDLVTANQWGEGVTVFLNLPEPSQPALAAAALVTLAGLRRRWRARVGGERGKPKRHGFGHGCAARRQSVRR